MMITKFREFQSRNSLTTFVPNPPKKTFTCNGIRGDFELEARSHGDDVGDNWVRGWTFTFRDENEAVLDVRYLDEEELTHLRRLLEKSSDPDVELGFSYRSVEGVIFNKFSDNHRVMRDVNGRLTSGLQGKSLISDIVDFMESSSKLWEKSGTDNQA